MFRKFTINSVKSLTYLIFRALNETKYLGMDQVKCKTAFKKLEVIQIF